MLSALMPGQMKVLWKDGAALGILGEEQQGAAAQGSAPHG